MVETCHKCGVEFEDNYINKNDLNKRIYCNKCVDELFNLNKLKEKEQNA